MAKILKDWEKMTILKVLNVSLEMVATVMSLRTKAGGEEIERVYEIEAGALVHIRNTDVDAEKAKSLLVDIFGINNVEEVYEG